MVAGQVLGSVSLSIAIIKVISCVHKGVPIAAFMHVNRRLISGIMTVGGCTRQVQA